MSYVITGNPGVGKHTIAKEISKKLHLPIIDINKIAKEFELLEKNDHTNDVDVKKLKNLIKKKISSPSLVVGHLAPYVLSTNQIKKVIVLRKNPYDLISIYKERKYSDKKIKDNLGSEVLGIILHDSISQFGPDNILQINATGQSIEEITKKIIYSINDKIKGDNVDWLGNITKKKDLQKFFSY